MATKRQASPVVSRHDSLASKREQALCLAALDSDEYDELSDQQWVAMCERIARESEADKKKAEALASGVGQQF